MSLRKITKVAEAVLFGIEQHGQEVDDAGAKLKACVEPFYIQFEKKMSANEHSLRSQKILNTLQMARHQSR